MNYNNPSLILSFVGSTVIPDTTVTNADIVRDSIQIEWQMMSNLKSTSDKAKITITKNTPAVSRIMSFDGDIKAILKDGNTVLFTGFLSNKYKWSVTNHGEQVLVLTIEDNTRLLETIFSDKDRLINEEFYLPATSGHPNASGLLKEICTVCGITIHGSVPSVSTNIIRMINADTECVDILDQVCFELGYCYKFNALGQLYLWQIARGNEPVSATLTKDSLWAVDENAVIVNKALKQYNRAIVKYTDISTRSDTLIYQDISGQDDSHPYCYIEVNPGMAYPSGLTIAGHTDDELRAVCEATDLDEGKTIIGIGDSITADFSCTASGITADIRKYSATSVSVLVKNTLAVPIYILKLRAKASVIYEEGGSKVYAGSVSDKKYYETSLEYVHDNTSASKLGNLIYQFYKHSNLSYQFYSKTQLALGSIIMLQENQHSGISAKLMVNARVDLSSSDVYQYVAYSFTPFNLAEATSSDARSYSPTVIPGPKGADGQDGRDGTDGQSVYVQYAVNSSPDTVPSSGWQDTVPSVSTGQYIWMRVKVGTSGSWQTSRLTGVDGTDGQDGQDGQDGADGQSIYVQYALGDSSTTAPSSGWQSTVPTLTSGHYIWMRSKVGTSGTWQNIRLTGETGEDGGNYGYELVVHGSTFNQDHRSTGSQSISVYALIKGYTNVTSTITATNATYSSANNNITIPLDNNFSEVIVTAVLTDNITSTVIETKTVTLNPVDITESPQFLGCIAGSSAPPSLAANGQKLIAGDHFCVSSSSGSYSKGDCYRYTDTGWIKLNSSSGTPTEMLNCLNGFKEANVSLASISDSSATAWFNGIVASKVITDSIFAKMAEVDSLTINENAIFNGTLNGSYLKTMNTTSSSTTYNSRSDQASGTSIFYWSDIQSVYSGYYNSSYYGSLLSASGTINGKSASKVVYHTSSSLSNKVETVASGNWGTDVLTQTITVCTAICSTKYRITTQLNYIGYINRAISYQIDRTDGTTESYQVIRGDGVSSTTITTQELHKGDVLKLVGFILYGEPYTVQLYHSDNYGVGTNVITSDGWKYNVNGSLPTVSNSQSITGTGTVKPSLTVNGTTWNVSSVQTIKGYPGQTGSYSAPSTGSSANISGTATIRWRGGSNTSYTIASASWSTTSITFTSTNGNTLTLNESTSDLEYWYIYFTVSTTTGGVVSKGLQPWSNNSYNIGASNNKWANGYFSNLYTTNLSTSSLDVSSSISASTFYGQLGTSSSRSNAYVSTLYANAISGVDLFNTGYMVGYGENTITTNKSTIGASSLSNKGIGIEGFKISSAVSTFYYKMAGSGTYSCFICLTPCYANNYTMSVHKYQSGIAAGSSMTVTISTSSGGMSGFALYWRTA